MNACRRTGLRPPYASKMTVPQTDDCRTAFQLANRAAEEHGSRNISWIHVLIGLASAPNSASASLDACGIDRDELRRHVLQLPEDQSAAGAKAIVGAALAEVRRLNHNGLDTGHFLLAMIDDLDGNCATILRAMGADLDELVVEIEKRLPQPTFPLQQALAEYADHPRVRKLNKQLDDAQEQIELHIQNADFETAALQRDKKARIGLELDALWEQLWTESHG